MSSNFFSVSKLPNSEWDFFWNHIHLPDEIKYDALRLILTEHKMSSLVRDFALSKIIFVHGPPGCGKTTMVRGVCNEAGKRMIGEQCYFAELNFHNLYSQNYGESEKLIAKAFKYVEELSTFGNIVFILFDEVESILTEREITLSNANPVDAFRGVNEVLKSIDELSLKSPKTFYFATSNLLSAVDKAFVDRTDRIFFVDFPNYSARFQILRDVCETTNKAFSASINMNCSKFRKLVYVTQGLSGRQLRKLVLETVTSSDVLYQEPFKIQIDDLISVALRLKARNQASVPNDCQFDNCCTVSRRNPHERR